MNAPANAEALRVEIEALFEGVPGGSEEDACRTFLNFRDRLSSGAIRAAEPDASQPTGWRVNAWVKKGILLGFRLGEVIEVQAAGGLGPFFDKSTYPLQRFSTLDRVRIVPGGSSVRAGAYLGRGVTCMPPMYVNVGAYVDEGTMIDSHALVGSCAQIGRHCHISAASQIGGVLEPVGAMPVIIEDEVLVGGNCGVYEGTIVKAGAVIGSGTVLNRSTPVYDLVRETVHRASDEIPIVVPEGAVVVAGSRPVQRGIGKDWNISLYTPVIVKYRDQRTAAKIQLEDLLR